MAKADVPPVTWETIEDQTAPGRVAIVDIGSNTVRLVVFHGPSRVALPLFNEKVQCGLGRGLDKTGTLHPEGLLMAFEALDRFMKLVKAMAIDTVTLLATAAVREARDGPDFVRTVKDRYGVDVKVLSGEQEAKLSAFGLLSGLPSADGLLGDMGGASFDLVELDNGSFGQHDTTPLGHLRIVETAGGDRDKMCKKIHKELSRIDWLKDIKGRPFYAVGGSLRAVARVLLEQTLYPLHVIDNYALTASAAKKYLDLLAGMSTTTLAQIPGVSRKRLDTLPAAVILMQQIIEVARPNVIVFSGYSMREGSYYMSLPSEMRGADPLISACEELVKREGRFGLQGQEIFHWMSPLFPGESPHKSQLRHAACLLNDIAWAEHPDYRAEHALLRVLRMPAAGLSHQDRALIAACIYTRHKGDFDAPVASPLKYLLAEEDTNWTRAVGSALRLAHVLTGGAPQMLKATCLDREEDTLALYLSGDGEVFVGDAVVKRVEALGRTIGLTGVIRGPSEP